MRGGGCIQVEVPQGYAYTSEHGWTPTCEKIRCRADVGCCLKCCRLLDWSLGGVVVVVVVFRKQAGIFPVSVTTNNRCC